jgi:4-amino-4-deoxy-L-arabinose transferase
VRLAAPRRLVLLFVAVFLLPLGLRPLFLPDESRYAEIAREMVARGDWVVPHLLGLDYFEKPVGGYWFNAASQWLFGTTEFASRLPTALATGFSALLVGLLAQRLWADRRTSAVAVLVYLSFTLVAALGVYITLDPQLTVWINLALLALHVAIRTTRSRMRIAAWVVVGAACGMGFLVKGFVAWALAFVVAVPYMLWRRRFGELLRYGPIAVVVAVLVAAPWAVAVHQRAPDFWNFFFWNEHVRRFASGDAQHGAPVWFYLPVLVLGCIPWLGLAPRAVAAAWSQRGDADIAFLLVWLLAPLLFFSAAHGKLPAYILICFTPAALLLARSLASELDAGRTRWLKANAGVNFAIGLVLLGGLAYARSRGLYGPEDGRAWIVAIAIALAWTLLALAQWRWPLRAWDGAALGVWLLIAGLPFVFTHELATSKQPSAGIRRHAAELGAANAVLCNDPGLCALVAWELRRTDVTLYQGAGELQYGLATPAGAGRLVASGDAPAWIAQQRAHGSVGVVMRVPPDSAAALAALPPGAAVRDVDSRLLVAIYPPSAPK